MITLENRKILMSWKESRIGFENDNAVEFRQFQITNQALFDYSFKLDIKSGENVGIVDLGKERVQDSVILTWEILKEHLSGGRLLCQIRAFSENDEVWHSEIAEFYVGTSINATDYFPPSLPSEFEQLEQRITKSVERAESAVENIEYETNLEALTNSEIEEILNSFSY